MFVHKVDMFEALRLTRAGKLREAMAVLQGRSSEDASPGKQGAVQGTSDVDRRRTVVDLEPPSDPSGTWKTRHAPDECPAPPAARDRGQEIAPSPHAPSFRFHIVRNHGDSRRYKLYVPAKYQGQPLPLVVMLHGCTQSPDDFAAGTRMNDLAEEQLFFVAYPEQPKSANAQKCWNWFKEGDQRRESGEPLLLAEVTKQIVRDHAVDESRIYIAGMSAGGAAAAIMGATYPDLYAAVGIHSGLACGAARDMPGAFAAMRDGAPMAPALAERAHLVPTIVFHGDRDLTVNPVNGDQVIAQATAGLDYSANVSQVSCPDGTGVTRTIIGNDAGRSVAEQWVVHGLGHAWSGGSPQGTFTQPGGPDASREFLRFFLQHRK